MGLRPHALLALLGQVPGELLPYEALILALHPSSFRCFNLSREQKTALIWVTYDSVLEHSGLFSLENPDTALSENLEAWLTTKEIAIQQLC